MNRRSLTLRAHALLTLAALALGAWAQASGLHGCASHLGGGPEARHVAADAGRLVPAAHEGHAARAGQGEAAGHAEHADHSAHVAPTLADSPAPTHHAPASEHGGACTCLGNCFAGAGISLPAYATATAPAARESAVTASLEGDVVAPLGRAAYLLPYATAPPSRA